MSRRVERVNQLIREGICEVLQRQIRDPRLDSLVTITEVATSPDLKYAKVFVSIIGSEEEKVSALQALTKASGFFYRELQQHLTLHPMPELSFCRDDSIEHGAHLLQLIEQVTSNKGSHRINHNQNEH